MTTFLAADSLCEILIGNGAARMVNTSLSPTERLVGEDLVKAALILQACLFISFISLAAIFERRVYKAQVLTKNIKSVLAVMYVSCVIITIRCAYRIVEFFLGYSGYIYTHEYFFWIFEATIMFINTAMLNIFHPGRYLPRSNKVFLSQDGHTELRGLGWADKRHWIISVFDPFDLYGLYTGRDSSTKFWELSREELDALHAERDAEKARKAALPRPFAERIVDPFHLFGPTGKIVKASKRYGDKMDSKQQKNNVNV